MAWYDKNSANTTHPVASKQPNAWGLYDMLGNVWEWNEDTYAAYPGGSVTGVRGPTGTGNKILRGGSWDFYPRYSRVSVRYGGGAALRYDYVGFRCAGTSIP